MTSVALAQAPNTLRYRLIERYLAFTRLRPGFFGRLGFVQHFYAPLPSQLLLEHRTAPGGEQISGQLMDRFVVETEGFAVELVFGHAEVPMEVDVRIRQVRGLSGRNFQFTIRPAIQHGGRVRVELDHKQVTSAEGIQLLAAFSDQLSAGSRDPSSRPGMVALRGWDLALANAGLSSELKLALNHLHAAGLSTLLCADLAHAKAADVARTLSAYRKRVDIAFVESGTATCAGLTVPVAVPVPSAKIG